MLTGKKIGALFFGIILVSLILFFPQRSLALDASAYNTPSSELTGITYTTTDDFYNYKVEEVRGTYTANPNNKTANIDSVNYFVTDGKTFAIYQRGSGNPEHPDYNNPDKAKLVGVIGEDNKYRQLKTPISKADVALQTDAINSAAKLSGSKYNAYQEIVKNDNSSPAVVQKAIEAREIEKQLQLAKDTRDQLEAMNEDTTEIEKEIVDLEKQWQEKKIIAKTANTGNQKGYAQNNPPETIRCITFSTVGVKAANIAYPSGVDVAGCFAMVGNVVLKGAAWILWATALIFDKTLEYTLGDGFKALVENTKIITVGWSILRDISNIFFIFLLLFVSIGIILNNSKIGSKSMIPSILLAAVLINFSLFFTKVIIDASNILTLQFYAQMRGDDPSNNPNNPDATGIAAEFVRGLNLTSLYKMGNESSSGSTGAAQSLQANATNAWSIILVSFGGTVLILITAFMFFAATMMFLWRAVLFIILMATAPIAFMAKAVSSKHLSELSSKWWKNLLGLAMFAPAYMALTYLVLVMIRTKGVGVQGNFASLFANGDPAGISTALTFIVIILFMIATLGISTSFGIVGASGVMSLSKKMGGWVGSRTLGSFGSRVANSGLLTNMAGTGVGRMFGAGLALQGANRLAGAKFAGSKSFKDIVAGKQKSKEDLAKTIEGRTLNRGMFESDETYNSRLKAYGARKKVLANNVRGVDEDGNRTGGLGFSYATRQARLGLQNKYVEKNRNAAKAEADYNELKQKEAETLRKLTGMEVKLEDKDGKIIEAKEVAEAVRKALEDSLEKDGGVSFGGSVGSLAKEIKNLEIELGKLKLGDAGKRDVLNGQVAQKRQDLTVAIGKVHTSADKIIQTQKKEDDALEKGLERLNETIKSSSKDKGK